MQVFFVSFVLAAISENQIELRIIAPDLHSVGGPPCGESGGLEIKVGLRADLVGSPRICSLLWNRALVRCLAGVNYEIPKLVSDDLIMGSELCPWNPTIVVHALLNSGVEAVLMCLDSLKLPNCARNPHISRKCTHVDSLSIRAHVFPYYVFPRLTQDEQTCNKPLK
ncbi:hypothetical protein M9H77_08140 [Catharanthus roseus]|uniref:Uncharacterized protein n=1 Tax=Catharanthus roseus TaxID=4058 RepID=A0ACC0BX41_CATRO|nr:hypothetical protein M9H77_08140 [Catharanthus roseus]